MDYGNIGIPGNTSSVEAPMGGLSNFRENQRTRSKYYSTTLPVIASENAVLRLLPPALFQMLIPSLRRMNVKKEQFLMQQDDILEYVYFPETAGSRNSIS